MRYNDIHLWLLSGLFVLIFTGIMAIAGFVLIAFLFFIQKYVIYIADYIATIFLVVFFGYLLVSTYHKMYERKYYY